MNTPCNLEREWHIQDSDVPNYLISKTMKDVTINNGKGDNSYWIWATSFPENFNMILFLQSFIRKIQLGKSPQNHKMFHQFILSRPRIMLKKKKEIPNRKSLQSSLIVPPRKKSLEPLNIPPRKSLQTSLIIRPRKNPDPLKIPPRNRPPAPQNRLQIQ